jgi:glycogen debranching enzyme
MYRLMFDLTQNQKYKVLENILKNKVRERFWNGKNLADGLSDWTIRPNIFIAAYVYPELLSNKEWEICLENSLKNLWLDWGGLSTIDKNNRLFTEIDTGEDIKSYHRGDSWFWLNNLAAIQLNKINNKKFQRYIQKIISASTEDILWKGCIGCASELSSAKELSSRGCFNQAWSNAIYLELIDEIFK